MGDVAALDRVFLDATVLFGASYRESSSLRALWSVAGVVLLGSTYVIEEVRRNAADDKHRARLGELVGALEVVETRFDPNDSRLEDVILPLKDRPVLIDAIDGRATHLLSGNRNHFGRYYGKQLRGIWIMMPNEYLAGKVRGS
jgi:uncharacterized protein